MDEKQKDNELDYQLAKLILFNLKQVNLLTADEVSIILKTAQKEYSTIIGALD